MTTGRKAIFFYLAFYLLFGAVAIRSLATYFSTDHPLRWLVAGLLLIYGVLLASESWLTRRWQGYLSFYFIFQAGLILGLLLLPPFLDFFAVLYIPLSTQTMLFCSMPTGFRWIGLFTLLMAAGLIYGYGWLDALPFALLYGAGYFFVGSYASVTAQAETARQESQTLLAELQTAHHQLQAYAAQAEELAATTERNHLARELHDSVTQTLFSITLTAKSARILLVQDSARALAQLDHLQELAQSALAEMRALIFQLRPTPTEAGGLVPALRRHMAALKDQAGLSVTLQVEGEPELPPEQETHLFRVVQEALNNVVKHAHTDQALVKLALAEGQVSLLVEDEGVGFDPAAVPSGRKTLGLTSIRERVEMMGGSFAVESRPGAGVSIRVEMPVAVLQESYGNSKV
ncbi:MAG: sensor histidine kinase [Anaerolineae bacterium]